MNIKVNVTNLHKSFGKLEVLRGIDLQIAEGEVVCIIGPSGSGKSTFLRCLNQLETATSGSIGGVNISDKFIGIASDSTTAVGSYFAANYFGLRNNANYFRVDMSGQSGNSALQCTIDKTTDTTAALYIRNATASTGSIGAMAIYAFGRNELLGGVQVISGSATITDDSKPKIEVTSTDLKVTLQVNNTGAYITGYLRITTSPASGGAATVQFIRD